MNYWYDINLVNHQQYAAYMVNSFAVSLNVPVINNIPYEMIKSLPEKILNAIYWNWLYNGTLEKNNSRNCHSNQGWING